ncbi:MAG TPA: DUF6491 family protein [Rhodanobacteraceae bacterium]|nr:DUF6491 family protein [Rhodanobacteraceae bacterium]
MNYKNVIAALLLPLLLVPAAQASSRAERLAQFEKFASAPVPQFRYFNMTGFETLSDDTVAVWTRVNEAYLIKVRQPCPNFDFAQAISLSNSQAHVVSARFDAVSFDGGRCMIESIRPVDYKAMRKAEQAAKAAKADAAGSAQAGQAAGGL